MNILLTSAGRRGYLVRYFKEAIGETGEVHVGNSTSISPAFYYADKSVVTPLIYDDNYIPFLLDYCKINDISVLISLFDVDLYILACHKEDFKKIGVNVIVSDKDVISICNDKWNTYIFCVENNFLVPKTYKSLDDAKSALYNKLLNYPVIVKPRWGMGSIGVFIADNEEELNVFYNKTRKAIENSYLKYEAKQDMDECVLIQEIIDGQEYGLDIINDLEHNYCNTIVRMKYAMRSGETDCALIMKNEHIEELGKTISEKLGHIANLDTDIFVKEDGSLYILEMNARFGGGYPFSHLAGVNLPMAIIKWMSHEVVDVSQLLTAKAGVLTQKDITMIDITKFKNEVIK